MKKETLEDLLAIAYQEHSGLMDDLIKNELKEGGVDWDLEMVYGQPSITCRQFIGNCDTFVDVAIKLEDLEIFPYDDPDDPNEVLKVIETLEKKAAELRERFGLPNITLASKSE